MLIKRWLKQSDQWRTDQCNRSWQHLHPVPLLPNHKLSSCLFAFPFCLSSEISLKKIREYSQAAKSNSFSFSIIPSFSTDLMVFFLGFRDISLFWVLMLSSWIIHSQPSSPSLPLILTHSHPQNINFKSFDKILLSTYSVHISEERLSSSDFSYHLGENVLGLGCQEGIGSPCTVDVTLSSR